MAKMSRYCRAYLLSDLEAYPAWASKSVGSAVDTTQAVDAAQAIDTQTPGGGAVPWLFLHDNYTVTNGIFHDEDVVFDDASPEWREFCGIQLGFREPPAE